VNVFLSYASEYRPVAESLSIGLIQAGHTTFFDRDSLPAAEGFHERIRNAIADADLVVFLVSPESVEAGSYALTELEFVSQRWPNPVRRILPVLVKRTPMEQVPAYLRAVTILEPQGDVVAHVLAEVDRIAQRAKRRRMLTVAVAVALAAALAGAIGFALRPHPSSEVCYLTAKLRPADTSALLPQDLLINVSHGSESGAFVVSEEGSSAIHVGPLTGPQSKWTLQVIGPDGAVLGRVEIQGCASSPHHLPLGEGLDLVLEPR
jgi:hypothetical protein